MKKLVIDKDEMYPVYFIRTKTKYDLEKEIEVSEEFLDEYARITDLFDRLQDTLAEMLNDAPPDGQS